MKILYLQPGLGIGGSKISLYQILKNAPPNQTSQVALALPSELVYEQMLAGCTEKIHYLDMPTWQKYRRSTAKELLKSPFSDTKRLLSLIPAVYKLVLIIKREKIDLVHTNNGMSPVGALAALMTNKPHVWHVREPIGTIGQYPLILGDRFSAFLFHRLSNVVVCISEYTSRFFRQFGYPVDVIQNGLDLQLFQDGYQAGKQLRNRLAGENDNPVIGMVGNLTTQWKGHIIFLELAAKIIKSMPNCRFVVFGSSTNLNLNSYTRELKANVERLGLDDNLIFADFVNDVPAIVHSIDILVHPALTEGSGRVVMEAMAAGKPVIGTRSGGVQELIQDGVTGFLVHPNDVNAFVGKVSFLLENTLAREKMGKQAAIYARINFSNEKMVRSIIELYSGIISHYVA